jgi:hypothetical protein
MDSKEAVLGYITANLIGPKLWKVEYSAAVHGHGPLLYQLVMTLIGSGWLKASETLTDDSMGVWNKMYELSEQGAYKRKFLGAFGVDEVIKSLSVDGAPPEIRSPAFYAKVKRIAADGGTSTEKLFLQELAAAGVSPSEVGWFWAYQTTRKDPQSNKLLAGGEGMLLASATETQPMVDKPRLEAVIDHMAARLFSRKFDEDV